MDDETKTRDARFAPPEAPVERPEPRAGASTATRILVALAGAQTVWVASSLGKFFELTNNGSMSAIALLELLIGWVLLAWGAFCLVRRPDRALTPFGLAAPAWLASFETMFSFVARDPWRWMRLESYFVLSMLLAIAGAAIAFNRRRGSA
jgi:hypothetical protein